MKRVRMSKQQLNRAYQNRMRRAWSGQEIDSTPGKTTGVWMTLDAWTELQAQLRHSQAIITDLENKAIAANTRLAELEAQQEAQP